VTLNVEEPRAGRLRRRSLLIAAGAVGCGTWWLTSVLSRPELRIRLAARSIASRNDIQVEFGPPSTFFVAPYSASDAALPGGHATAATDPALLLASLQGIQRALEAYPADFARRLIKAVFVCGELTLDGARADGTYGPAWLIIGSSKLRDPDGAFAASFRALHHELSSFVLQYAPATLTSWKRFTPPDWVFARNGDDELARMTGQPPDPRTGFISGYGGTNYENDFNAYAEEVFAAPTRLVSLARTTPLVRAKLDFVLGVYISIEPAMAAAFERLGVTERAAG
jgi:hypothetical protein